MLKTVANFLLSEWLWSITTDWYHIPISILLMCIMFRWVLKMTIIPAVLMSFLSHIYAFSIFSLFVVGVLLYVFDSSYESVNYMVTSPFFACLYLGFIYAFLQITFFCIIGKWYRLRCIPMSIVAICCNVIVSGFTFYLFGDSLL